jgi:hypothetical protein
MLMHPVYRVSPCVADARLPARAFHARESTPVMLRFLDRVRAALRARHCSRRTEEACIAWIKRYIFFQALSALLFLYRNVLQIDLPWLDGIVRSERPHRLPVVLTREELRAVLRRLDGMPRLMACVLYGAGRRVLAGFESTATLQVRTSDDLDEAFRAMVRATGGARRDGRSSFHAQQPAHCRLRDQPYPVNGVRNGERCGMSPGSRGPRGQRAPLGSGADGSTGKNAR